MSIVLFGSTSGSVTLQEPAAAGSTVLTLPNAAGTLITTGSSGQSIPKAALPTGSVLQVVQATLNSDQSTTSTSYSSTGLAASITPTSSSSKILVMLSACAGKNGSSGGAIQVWRGGSSICLVSENIGFDSTSNNTNQPMVVIHYLDSPATTSSTTYTIYFKANTSGQTFKFGVNSSVSTLTLMEIAA
jgi:hypothetical protein